LLAAQGNAAAAAASAFGAGLLAALMAIDWMESV